jgi:hypothetical protein
MSRCDVLFTMAALAPCLLAARTQIAEAGGASVDDWLNFYRRSAR